MTKCGCNCEDCVNSPKCPCNSMHCLYPSCEHHCGDGIACERGNNAPGYQEHIHDELFRDPGEA